MAADKALDAFLNTAKSKNSEIAEELLIEIYNIEKSHQFRDQSDRGAATREIENAVDKYFENEKN